VVGTPVMVAATFDSTRSAGSPRLNPSWASPDLAVQFGALVELDAAVFTDEFFEWANDGAAKAVPARRTAPAAIAVTFTVLLLICVSFRWIADPLTNLGKAKNRKVEIQDAVSLLPAISQPTELGCWATLTCSIAQIN
jgi:hypothetical protein